MSLKTGASREEWDSRDVGGTRFTERVFVTMIAQAQATQEAEVEAEIKFHSSPKVASTPVYAFGKGELMKLKKQKEDGGDKPKELKLRADKKLNRIIAEQMEESDREKEITIAPKDKEAVEISDPEDFPMTMAPPAF